MNRAGQIKHSGILPLLSISLLLVLFSGIREVEGGNLSRIEGLKNVGPVDPVHGYPLWYEDKSGLMLGLCTDYTRCFIAPPDPGRALMLSGKPNDPAANFPDEVFFYAAESIIFGTDGKTHAILVQALEGTFMNEMPIQGDQIVFSRIRIRINNLIEGETYTVTYPYGEQTFVADVDAGPGIAPGPGYSMTRDIGITAALDFKAPVHGDIGPFLVPLSYAGGPFLSDGGITPELVTGSPRGTNFFRIEGWHIADGYPPEYHCKDATLGPDPVLTSDCIESKEFAVMGQLATQMGVEAERATFSKLLDVNGMEETYVNVWARSAAGQALVASVDGGPLIQMTEGTMGSYFARILSPGGIPKEVKVSNTSDVPTISQAMPVIDELSITDASYAVGVGLHISVQGSNHVDPGAVIASLITGQALPREISLIHQGNGLWEGDYLLTPGGVVSENAPFQIEVHSSYGGFAKSEVIVTGAETQGGVLNRLLASAGPDQRVLADGATIILNGSGSVGPGTMTYAWTHDAPGQIALSNADSVQTSFVVPTTPIPGGILPVNLTLTVRDGTITATDTVTVFITQPSALPTDQCTIESASFLSSQGKWLVSGACDLLANQVIEVWLGNSALPQMVFIGRTWVDAIGGWQMKTGPGSAPLDQTIPLSGTHTQVTATSSRGSRVSAGYVIKN